MHVKGNRKDSSDIVSVTWVETYLHYEINTTRDLSASFNNQAAVRYHYLAAVRLQQWRSTYLAFGSVQLEVITTFCLF